MTFMLVGKPAFVKGMAGGCSGQGHGVAANCHNFQTTGPTACLHNGGAVGNTQTIAAHKSLRTTKLDDRLGDEITLDALGRTVIQGLVQLNGAVTLGRRVLIKCTRSQLWA